MVGATAEIDPRLIAFMLPSVPDSEGPAAALKMLRQDIDHLDRVLDL
jgi:hypothetical protein